MAADDQAPVTGWLPPLRWADPSVSTPGLPGALHLPVGTVTFLLTDIAGSTLAWRTAPDAMQAAVTQHYELLDAAISAHGGVRPEEQGEGDSVVAAFSRASDAIAAALDAQLAIQRAAWPAPNPIEVRMAVHTGEARLRDDANYVGMAIIRTARLRNIAHGGQVLVSSASRDLALDQLGEQLALRELGEHRLKDLARPERVFQLVHPDLPSEFAPLRSLDSMPNNLPVRLSTFIGRETELNALAELMLDARLVTVTGSGGAGKTRLALQAAAETMERFRDGVWWVELAPLGEAVEVGAALGDVLGLNLDGAGDVHAAISRRLVADTALVVLDNCEHLLEACGDIAAVLLERCPDIRVLATSRIALDVPGETMWRIPPLALPTTNADEPIERLAHFDAVRLFLDRARRVRPGFSFTDDNGPAIAEICHRLNGIPLAIELAAARTKSMTPANILTGLSDSLRLLTGGSRLTLPRQQTLDASIRWSVALLPDREQLLLARLSVFSGSFDLPDAEAVCSGEGLDPLDVLDSLERLIDHSLVVARDDDVAGRFHLLETVRQYGTRWLAQRDGADDLPSRHAHHFAQLAADLAPLAETADEFAALDALDAAIDNVRAALWWFENQGDAEGLADMAFSLAPYWDANGRQSEAIGWFTRALDLLPGEPSVRHARLLATRGEGRFSTGEFMGSRADCALAVQMGDDLEDPYAMTRGRYFTASAFSYFSVDDTRDVLERAAALAEETGDHYIRAASWSWLGSTLAIHGAFREGAALMARSRPAVEATGNPTLLATLQIWEGRAALYRGELSHAADISTDAAASGGLRSSIRRSGADQTIALVALYQGVASPLVDRLEDLVRIARRDGERQGERGYEITLVSKLVVTDPASALEMTDRRMRSPSGAPITDCQPPLFGGYAALALGDPDRARVRALEAERLAADGDNRWALAAARMLLARVALESGETESADAAIHAAITLDHDNGNVLDLIPDLETVAMILASCGGFPAVARVLGAVDAARTARGIPHGFGRFDPPLTATLTRTRSELGNDAFDAAWTAGAALNLDEIVAYVRRTRGTRRRPLLGWNSLTPTERNVVELVRIGLTNKQIADELLMGSETVKTHLSHIFAKLDAANRAKVAAIAERHRPS